MLREGVNGKIQRFAHTAVFCGIVSASFGCHDGRIGNQSPPILSVLSDTNTCGNIKILRRTDVIRLVILLPIYFPFNLPGGLSLRRCHDLWLAKTGQAFDYSQLTKVVLDCCIWIYLSSNIGICLWSPYHMCITFLKYFIQMSRFIILSLLSESNSRTHTIEWIQEVITTV